MIVIGCIGSSLEANYVLYPVGAISSLPITSLVQPFLSSSSDGRVSVLEVHEGCEGLELTDFPVERRGLDLYFRPTLQDQAKDLSTPLMDSVIDNTLTHIGFYLQDSTPRP